MKKLNNILIFLFISCTVLAQTRSLCQDEKEPIKLSFRITFGSDTYKSDQLTSSKEIKVPHIETCQFYLSNFILMKRGTEVWREENSHHLLNVNDNKSLSMSLNCPRRMKFDGIQFLLGIDSLTSVSGAYGGDLDPTNGMYWAWNSGYINFKLEGSHDDCPTRNNQFHFHLGGYLPPYSAAQRITLDVKKSKSIDVRVDLSTFTNDLDWSRVHSVMSPSQEAQRLSTIAASMFSIDVKK